MTLELTSLILLVGSLVENPLAVKHLDNGLYIHLSYFFNTILIIPSIPFLGGIPPPSRDIVQWVKTRVSRVKPL